MSTDHAYGLVSLIEGRYERRIKAVWAELREKFGLNGASAVPYPHLAYQFAGQYHEQALHDAIARLARSRNAFTARVSGLEVLEGPQPVIYLRLLRSPELLSFQRLVWQETFLAATDLPPHYHPDRWVPQLTLAEGDLDAAELPRICAHLAEQDFQWQIPIANLALLVPGMARPRVKWRFDLG